MDWSLSVKHFEVHLRLERNLSANTVEAYLHDVALLRRWAEAKGCSPTRSPSRGCAVSSPS